MLTPPVTTTLKAMKETYGCGISLMGKVLNINTYIYSQIWNNGYIINTKDKHFKNFAKSIEAYLNYSQRKAMKSYNMQRRE